MTVITPSLLYRPCSSKTRVKFLHSPSNSLVEFSFLHDASANTVSLTRLNALFEKITDRQTMGISKSKLFRMIQKTKCPNHTIEKYRIILEMGEEEKDAVDTSTEEYNRVLSRGPFLSMFKYENITFVNSLENAAKLYNSRRIKKMKQMNSRSGDNSKLNKLLLQKNSRSSITSNLVIWKGKSLVDANSRQARGNQKRIVRRKDEGSDDKFGMVVVTKDHDELSTVSNSTLNSAITEKCAVKKKRSRRQKRHKSLNSQIPLRIKTRDDNMTNSISSRRVLKRTARESSKMSKHTRSATSLSIEDTEFSDYTPELLMISPSEVYVPQLNGIEYESLRAPMETLSEFKESFDFFPNHSQKAGVQHHHSNYLKHSGVCGVANRLVNSQLPVLYPNICGPGITANYMSSSDRGAILLHPEHNALYLSSKDASENRCNDRCTLFDNLSYFFKAFFCLGQNDFIGDPNVNNLLPCGSIVAQPNSKSNI